MVSVAAAVLVAATVPALVGWAALDVVRRIVSRPGVVWAGIAAGFAVLSPGGPLSGQGVSSVDRLVLAVLHLSVAGVFIPLMVSTINPHREDRREQPVQ